MKKTKTFEQYLKEATNKLVPLEDEDDDETETNVSNAVNKVSNLLNKIPRSDEEPSEDEAIEDVSDEIEDSADELSEFELDAIPTQEPVLEPEESLPDELETIAEPIEDTPDIPETPEVTKKTVFLFAGVNNVEEENPAFSLVEKAKEAITGGESEIVKLFQLNIQPVGDIEPDDGMQLVYDQLDIADVIILVSPLTTSGISGLANQALDRITNHYGPGGLKNKIFGSILIGEDAAYSTAKGNLTSKAINLGMIVAPAGQALSVEGDIDFTEFAESIISIRDATKLIRPEVVSQTTDEEDVLSFGEFSNAADAAAEEVGTAVAEPDILPVPEIS
ncbi:MAG: flavodoxin family protein, partial [Candidatus Heimdallarchaeota archaeon]